MWLRLLALLPAVFLTCSDAAFAEIRVALVIGNSTYKTVTVLPNPANDAKLFTDFLKSGPNPGMLLAQERSVCAPVAQNWIPKPRI